jgi:hypothetical protein
VWKHDAQRTECFHRISTFHTISIWHHHRFNFFCCSAMIPPPPASHHTQCCVYGPDFMIEVLIFDCLIHSNMLTTCIYLASNISSNRLEFMLFYCQPLEYSVSITDQSNVDSWYENTSCQFQYNVFCGKDSTIHPHRSVTWQCFVIPPPPCDIYIICDYCSSTSHWHPLNVTYFVYGPLLYIHVIVTQGQPWAMAFSGACIMYC